MCGVVATVVPRNASLLSHRGPSGAGAFGAALPWGSVSLEQTRLAIVDRSDIAVPFDFRASCGVVVAYNGEVYNWLELRAELSDGTPWQTSCDAEVLARGWRRWGVDVLHHLNGMFAFVLVDESKGIVFAARDRAGEKPLYYAPLGTGICFASEVKAMPIELREAPCAELETLEFDCLETTPFESVRCLGPGEYVLLRSPSDLACPTPRRWWDLPEAVDESMTWTAAVDETEALLADAVQLRVPVDVPSAIQVSGGLDSALVLALAKRAGVLPQHALTVSFPGDGVNCMPLASAALAEAAIEHVPVTFGLGDLERVLHKVAYHLDTPATWTAVCQWFMAEAAAKRGAVVTVSGEGADELFGGYSRYRILWHLSDMAADTNLAAYEPLLRAVVGDRSTVLARMLNRGGDATLPHAMRLVNRFASTGEKDEGSLCRWGARVDFYTTMQVLLRMADRMAAAHSLENRSPFFDHRVMELAARMPTRFKITRFDSKAVLREVAQRVGVSARIVEDRNKRGLFVPWARWTGAGRSGRGPWDRSSFALQMRSAWRRAFGLKSA